MVDDDRMAIDYDDDEEVEEVVVLAHFTDFKESTFLRESKQISFLTFVDKPRCNIDGFVFTGEHQLSLGSLVLVPSEEGWEQGTQERDNEPVLLCNKKTEFRLKKIPLKVASTSEEPGPPSQS
jgi:hypothetical protein